MSLRRRTSGHGSVVGWSLGWALVMGCGLAEREPLPAPAAPPPLVPPAAESNATEQHSPEALTANGVNVDNLKSILITDQSVVSGFTLQAVLDQITGQVPNSGITSKALFDQLWDTFNATPGLDATKPHCSDNNGTLNGFPMSCRSAEGSQATVSDPFSPSLFVATALANRADLIDPAGKHCGEYRIVFGRPSGGRAFMIFEAELPNPHPELGIDGCRPVQAFWRDLSSVSSLTTIQARVKDFYFTGLPGFRPAIHVLNYNTGPQDLPGLGGRIRTNEFIQAPWTLREFKLFTTCTGSACSLVATPVTVKSSPPGSLFNINQGPPGTAAFQDFFVKTAVPQLVQGVDLNTLAFDTPDTVKDANGVSVGVNAAEHESQTATLNNYDQIMRTSNAPDTTFINNIQGKLNSLGSSLNPDQVVNRANVQSCAGCHEQNGGADIGFGTGNQPPAKVGPFSLGFVHVAETVDPSTGRFQISPALSQVFVPFRAMKLAALLDADIKVQKVSETITVDGNLSEASWDLRNTVTQPGLGTGNNSASYGVLWNSQGLLVGIEVLDGTLKNDSAGQWDDDAVEIYLDGDDSKSAAYDSDDRQYIQRWNDTGLFEQAARTAGVQHAVTTIPGGYAVEMLIPWSQLGLGGAPTAGKRIGFAIGVDDDDDGGARDSLTVSQGGANDFRDPRLLGNLVLDGTTTTGRIVAAKASTPIVVDGKLSEASWTKAGLASGEVKKNVDGASNNRVTYNVIWDSTNLYVAATVFDSVLRNDSPGVWNDDAVEIYIDPNHSKGTTFDANDRQFIIGWNDTGLFEKNGHTAGVLSAFANLPGGGGYVVELVVPWTQLGFASAPPVGTLIGLDVGNDDDDVGGNRQGQAVTFGTVNDFQDTSKYGDVILGN